MNGYTAGNERAALPLVSIVTPVLDGCRFVARAVDSVLAQRYPNVEYIVVDGGSTDGTLEILRGYGSRLTLLERSGANQAEALNLGFERARGEIFGFLNSDDAYLPDAVAAAVAALNLNQRASAAYGEADHVDDLDRTLGPYPVEPFDPDALARRCIVCQPAAFFRAAAFHSIGGFDTSLDFALDYDLWIRLSRVAPLVKFDAKVAHSRMHAGNKTLGRRRAAYGEAMRVLGRQYGYVPYEWVFAYASHLIDRRDHFFETSRPTRLGVLWSLAVGLAVNRRHAVRYFRDWVAHRGFATSGR